jgi:hypothetical protein
MGTPVADGKVTVSTVRSRRNSGCTGYKRRASTEMKTYHTTPSLSLLPDLAGYSSYSRFSFLLFPSRPTDLCMAAAASSKGRAIAGSFVTRVLAGSPRCARSPLVSLPFIPSSILQSFLRGLLGRSRIGGDLSFRSSWLCLGCIGHCFFLAFSSGSFRIDLAYFFRSFLVLMKLTE